MFAILFSFIAVFIVLWDNFDLPKLNLQSTQTFRMTPPPLTHLPSNKSSIITFPSLIKSQPPSKLQARGKYSLHLLIWEAAAPDRHEFKICFRGEY